VDRLGVRWMRRILASGDGTVNERGGYVAVTAGSSLDQRISDFAQKLDLLRWRRRWRRVRALQLVDLLDHQENDERQIIKLMVTVRKLP
jgi:hypothetical protein